MKSRLSDTPWSRPAWALALAVPLVLLVAVFLPPVLAPELRGAFMAGFHVLCHQLPSRSFIVDGVQLAVCHRCTGIYIGLVLGVGALYPLGVYEPRTNRWEGAVLLVAAVPAAIDWGGDVAGLWTNTVTTRVITGLWFGLLAGHVGARAMARRPDGPSEAESM